jgi:GNAT superfamily N-acetyltransferase
VSHYIATLTPQDLPDLAQLQQKYLAACPNAVMPPGVVYLSPGFAGGKNVFCARDDTGALVGFAPLFPSLVEQGQHSLWVDLLVDPGLPGLDRLRDALLDRLCSRAGEILAGAKALPAQLIFQYFPDESERIDYVKQRGFTHAASVFTMGRDLLQPIPPVTVPVGITIRSWRMESLDEQEAYIAARNICFPESPVSLGDWQFFMESPMWAVGTCFAAFNGPHLAGSLIAFWDEAENRRAGRSIGFTEYIFVLPQWRGRRIAQALILSGLGYLRSSGLQQAILEVKATNQTALGLYQETGFQVLRESWFLQRAL